MGEDVVHLPAHPVQAGPGGPVLLLAGQLLLPPGKVVYPIHRAPGVQLPAFFLEQRIVRLQDAVLDVVAAGPAHGEEPRPTQVEYLAPLQQDHRGADSRDFPTPPFLQRI